MIGRRYDKRNPYNLWVCTCGQELVAVTYLDAMGIHPAPVNRELLDEIVYKKGLDNRPGDR